MSAKRKLTMPTMNSLSGLLLTFVALSGELPVTLVSRLPSNKAYQEKVVKRLKGKGLLRTFYRNGLRGLRLTTAAKDLFLKAYPDYFQSYLTGRAETNRVKSEVTRRLRLYRMAEVLVTMHNTSVLSFPWEKAPVFQADAPPPSGYIPLPAYYSSREVKEIGFQSSKIRGSRATGVLMTDGGIFVVYNTGPSQMKWHYNAEIKLKAMIQTDVCLKLLPGQFMDARINAIVFGTDMDHLDALLGVGDGKSHNYCILDGSFEEFYFLTSDHRGEILLRLLYDDEASDTLDTILSEDLLPKNEGLPIENDAMDGSTPVLFGYTCNMPRLRRFDTALTLREQDGLVICFDYQEEAYRRCLGPRTHLQCIDFAACEQMLFGQHAPAEPVQ